MKIKMSDLKMVIREVLSDNRYLSQVRWIEFTKTADQTLELLAQRADSVDDNGFDMNKKTLEGTMFVGNHGYSITIGQDLDDDTIIYASVWLVDPDDQRDLGRYEFGYGTAASSIADWIMRTISEEAVV